MRPDPRSFCLILVVVLTLCSLPVWAQDRLRLPWGDAERGKAVFMEMQCYSCHRIGGMELPPLLAIDEPVILGRESSQKVTDAYLITSIINPSHELAEGYSVDQITMKGGKSRMPQYSDMLTVRELIDLVSFLRTYYSQADTSTRVKEK